MTWYFDPSGDEYTLYDPGGNAHGPYTIPGGNWTDCPDNLHEKAVSVIINLDLSLNLTQACRWHLELTAGDIEEGTP